MDVQQVKEKLKELQKYIPLLEKLIQKYRKKSSWARSKKLNPFEKLKTILLENNPYNTDLKELLVSEKVLENISKTFDNPVNQSSQSAASQTKENKSSKIIEIIDLDEDEEDRFKDSSVSKRSGRIDPELEENFVTSTLRESSPKYNLPDESHVGNNHYNATIDSTSRPYCQNGYIEGAPFSGESYPQNVFKPSQYGVPNNYYYYQSSRNCNVPLPKSDAMFQTTYGFNPQLRNGSNLNYPMPLKFNNKFHCTYCIFGSETEPEMRAHLRQWHYSLAPNMYVHTSVNNRDMINESSTKPPVRELNEYCKLRRLIYLYEMEPVRYTNNNREIFQFRVKAGDAEALGATKLTIRGARNAAAAALLDVLTKNERENEKRNSRTMDNIDLRTDNPIGVLQEVCLKLNWPIPTYYFITEETHPVGFRFVCTLLKHEEVGLGDSKESAKKNAALKMLEKLRKSPLSLPSMPQWSNYEKVEKVQSPFNEKNDKNSYDSEADLQNNSNDNIETENKEQESSRFDETSHRNGIEAELENIFSDKIKTGNKEKETEKEVKKKKAGKTRGRNADESYLQNNFNDVIKAENKEKKSAHLNGRSDRHVDQIESDLENVFNGNIKIENKEKKSVPFTDTDDGMRFSNSEAGFQNNFNNNVKMECKEKESPPFDETTDKIEDGKKSKLQNNFNDNVKLEYKQEDSAPFSEASDRIVGELEVTLENNFDNNVETENKEEEKRTSHRFADENEANLENNSNENVESENMEEENWPFIKEELLLDWENELMQNSYSNDFNPYIDHGIDSGFYENTEEDGNFNEGTLENRFEETHENNFEETHENNSEEENEESNYKEGNYLDETAYGPSESDSYMSAEAKISISTNKTKAELKKDCITSDGSNIENKIIQKDHNYMIFIKKEPEESSEKFEKRERNEIFKKIKEEKFKKFDAADGELSGTSLYLCGLKNCDYSAETESDLNEHLLVCDFSRNSPMLTCPHCHMEIKKNGSFLKHLRLHGEKKYSCGLCNYTSGQEKGVVLHVKNKHKMKQTKTIRRKNAPKGYFIIVPEEGDDQSDKTNPIKTEETATVGKTINFLKKFKPAPKNMKMRYRCGVCLVCDYVTSKEASDHLLEIHNVQSKYQCDICGVKTNWGPFFRSHFPSKHKGEKISYKRFILRLGTNGEVINSDSASAAGKHKIPKDEEDEVETKRFKKNDSEPGPSRISTPPNPSGFSGYVHKKKKILLTKIGEDFMKNSFNASENTKPFFSLTRNICDEKVDSLDDMRKFHSLKNIKNEKRSEND